MLKILQKNKYYIISVLAVLAVTFAFWWTTAEPEQCALCGGLKYHAPCIVNLATGEVGELMIYEPHHTKVGEIAEEQPGGTFAFLPCVGQRAVQDTNAETCTVQLPESRKRMKPQYFCRSCRELLHGMRGYALVDLHDLNPIQEYSIQNGAVYKIRDYIASVTKEDGSILMRIQGMI